MSLPKDDSATAAYCLLLSTIADYYLILQWVMRILERPLPHLLPTGGDLNTRSGDSHVIPSVID